MMAVLKERGLKLSRKKSCKGTIDTGFHFLGIDWLGTRPPAYTKVANSKLVSNLTLEDNTQLTENQNNLLRIVPHVRTLRKAREQVKAMVSDGFSASSIRTYLSLWAAWWARTSDDWNKQNMIQWFIEVCWDREVEAIAADLLDRMTPIEAVENVCASPLVDVH
jgi:hypothetical protein